MDESDGLQATSASFLVGFCKPNLLAAVPPLTSPWGGGGGGGVTMKGYSHRLRSDNLAAKTEILPNHLILLE